jgi:hypothetical protein
MYNVFLQAVRWAEDVVDNELLGKKKSKSEFPLAVLSVASVLCWGVGWPHYMSRSLLEGASFCPTDWGFVMQNAAYFTSSKSLETGLTTRMLRQMVNVKTARKRHSSWHAHFTCTIFFIC